MANNLKLDFYWYQKIGRISDTISENPSYVNLPGRYGNTLLHFIIINNRIEYYKLLANKYDFSPSINLRNNGGSTPLHYIARYNHIEVLKIILDEN